MTQDIKRLKRQLLRDLVQENVDLIEGNLPKGLRKRRGPLVVRVLALAALSLGLFGSTRLLPPLAGTPANAVKPDALARAVPSAIPGAIPAVAVGLPFSEDEQSALTVLEDATPIDAAVFPLAVRKIAIDPGHGGDSLGTQAPLGLVEKELTLDIAKRLRKLLEGDSYEILMTRESDTSLSLEERGLAANQAGADIFLSIHLNWIENRKARGVETYYLGPTNDPFLTRLAAAENRESGYSMADMRRLLDRIYAGMRQKKSRKLAEVVQTSLFGSLGKVSPGLENRGVKAAPFIVLLTTEMPAILAEVSCLSNEEEAQLLTQPEYRQTIAEALAAGIRSYSDSVEDRPTGIIATGAAPKVAPKVAKKGI